MRHRVCTSLNINVTHISQHTVIFTGQHHPSHVYTTVINTLVETGYTSSPVTVALEVKPQLEDVVVKLTAKSPLVRILPLAVYDLESNILHSSTKYIAQNIHKKTNI